MERLTCDVVVLGGGTAGCVVAGRLAAESAAEVVVLEAGPDYGPHDSGHWPSDLLDGGALASAAAGSAPPATRSQSATRAGGSTASIGSSSRTAR